MRQLLLLFVLGFSTVVVGQNQPTLPFSKNSYPDGLIEKDSTMVIFDEKTMTPNKWLIELEKQRNTSTAQSNQMPIFKPDIQSQMPINKPDNSETFFLKVYPTGDRK